MPRQSTAAERALLGATALTLLANLGVNGLNYGFQISMGRLLTPGDYTVLQSLLACYSIVLVPAAPIMMLLTKAVVIHHKVGAGGSVRALLRRSLWQTSLGSAALLALYAVAGRYLVAYFELPEARPMFYLLTSIALGLYHQVALAVLLGELRFKLYNGIALASGAMKLIGCLVLVKLQLGLDGVLLGLVLTNLTTSTIGLALAWRGLGTEVSSDPSAVSAAELPPAMIANLSFVMLTQIDIIYVAHYLKAQSAAGYGAVSMLAKLLFYIPTAVAVAMFPMVGDAKIERHARRRMLRLTLLATGAMVAVGLAGYLWLPGLVMRLTFGSGYLGVLPLLVPCGLAAASYGFVNVLIYYSIARGMNRFSYLLGALCIVVLAALFILHPPLYTMLALTGGAGALALIAAPFLMTE